MSFYFENIVNDIWTEDNQEKEKHLPIVWSMNANFNYSKKEKNKHIVKNFKWYNEWTQMTILLPHKAPIDVVDKQQKNNEKKKKQKLCCDWTKWVNWEDLLRQK